MYSYEYMDDCKRFEETSLPPKEAFYSRLSDEGTTDKQYQQAQNDWLTLTTNLLLATKWGVANNNFMQ